MINTMIYDTLTAKNNGATISSVENFSISSTIYKMGNRSGVWFKSNIEVDSKGIHSKRSVIFVSICVTNRVTDNASIIFGRFWGETINSADRFYWTVRNPPFYSTAIWFPYCFLCLSFTQNQTKFAFRKIYTLTITFHEIFIRLYVYFAIERVLKYENLMSGFRESLWTLNKWSGERSYTHRGRERKGMKTRVNSILLIEQVHKILAKKFYLPLLLITPISAISQTTDGRKILPVFITNWNRTENPRIGLFNFGQLLLTGPNNQFTLLTEYLIFASLKIAMDTPTNTKKNCIKYSAKSFQEPLVAMAYLN